MNTNTWLRRLSDQLPGWKVWYALPISAPWHAAPAPAGTRLEQVGRLLNRVDAATPQELRALCRDRYGWDDTCDTCGVPARDCGHRQPERTT